MTGKIALIRAAVPISNLSWASGKSLKNSKPEREYFPRMSSSF